METMTHQLTISRPVGGIVETGFLCCGYGCCRRKRHRRRDRRSWGRFGQTVSSFCSVSADPPGARLPK